MTDDNGKSNSAETIKAVTGLVNAVPVYGDLIQPAAKEIGKSLGTLAKAINLTLAPVSALVWGYEKIGGFISSEMEKKLKDVPIENISTPNPVIAGATIEALRFVGSDDTLRELYTNLLASSMNLSKSDSAHPAFVEVIKQLSSSEAQLIQKFSATNTFPEICRTKTEETMKSASKSSFANEIVGSEKITGEFNKTCSKLYKEAIFDLELDNLLRLRLIEHEKKTSQKFKDREMKPSAAPTREISDYFDDIVQINVSTFDVIRFTSFGINFVKACVDQKYKPSLEV